MGGENDNQPALISRIEGLSPRGRGKLGPFPVLSDRHGSIPAWAGETFPGCPTVNRPWVYPRVGGGNYRSHRRPPGHQGLSPRGRGKRIGRGLGQRINGSIPAWAGETEGRGAKRMARTVYPRVGGGNWLDAKGLAFAAGLSPRGRGKQVKVDDQTGQEGSIPAWAGETCGRDMPSAGLRVYPRVGGGNSSPRLRQPSARGLSPRGRGKLGRPATTTTWPRSIPAWAGETTILPPQ